MSDTVGTIEYDARINTAGFKSDAASIDKSAKQLSTNIDNDISKGADNADKNLKSSMSNMSSNIAGTIASFAAIIGITTAVGKSLTDLAGLQTARSGFEVLTGSAETASQVMKQIGDYANTTPFEFPDIASSAKTLLGFGIAAGDVDSDIRMLGDAVAASGGEFSGVSRVFGQIFAAGKINAQDFNQLIDNGIALGPEISKRLGVPISKLKEKIEQGAVTANIFKLALQDATSEGGKYFGATDKLADTLNGRISTLKDTFTGFVGKIVGVDFSTGIVVADGAFSTFSDTIKNITGFLQTDGVTAFNNSRDAIINLVNNALGYLSPKISEVWTSITTELLPALSNFWHNYLEPLMPVIGTLFVGVLGTVIDACKLIVDAFSFVIKGFNDGNPFILATAGVFGTLAAAMAFNAIFDALTVGFATFTLITLPSVMTTISGFASFLSVPLVMAAIDVGLAIAAISDVMKAYDAMDAAINSKTTEIKSREATFKYLNSVIADPNASAVKKAQAKQSIINLSTRASGGPVSAFSPYLVGENPDGSLNKTSELFVPRTSGTIVNSKDLQSALGSNNGGSVSNTFNINLSGIMASSATDEREIAKRLVERINEELRAKGKMQIGIA